MNYHELQKLKRAAAEISRAYNGLSRQIADETFREQLTADIRAHKEKRAAAPRQITLFEVKK